jgi:hypothetical protein
MKTKIVKFSKTSANQPTTLCLNPKKESKISGECFNLWFSEESEKTRLKALEMEFWC